MRGSLVLALPMVLCRRLCRREHRPSLTGPAGKLHSGGDRAVSGGPRERREPAGRATGGNVGFTGGTHDRPVGRRAERRATGPAARRSAERRPPAARIAHRRNARAPGGGSATGGTAAGQAGQPERLVQRRAVPANGHPADTSSPTTVVGHWHRRQLHVQPRSTPPSARAGVITFNCGSAAVTIPITATMNLPINKNTVIDGGNKVTLDSRSARFRS